MTQSHRKKYESALLHTCAQGQHKALLPIVFQDLNTTSYQPYLHFSGKIPWKTM